MPYTSSSDLNHRRLLATFAVIVHFLVPRAYADAGITIDPASIAQSSVINGKTGSPISVQVTNNGNTDLDGLGVYQGSSSCGATQSAAWLALSTQSLNVPVDAYQIFNVTLNPAGLATGTYTATVCVGLNPIPVAFTITPKPPDIVYLHECANDCSVKPGNDNAILHTSSIVDKSVTLAPFPYSDDVFNAAAACTRAVLRSFDIHVITSDPGPVARREIMMSTTSPQIEIGSGATQVSTVALENNAIGFVFATYSGGSVDDICWYTATTIGNLYSAEPVLGCPDIMGESTGCGEKSFDNASFTCDGSEFGEPGKCLTGQSTQNSFEILRAGAGAPEFIFTNSFEAFEVPSHGPSP
jgi:hypothetical protein